jgi:hypothetical protein
LLNSLYRNRLADALLDVRIVVIIVPLECGRGRSVCVHFAAFDVFDVFLRLLERVRLMRVMADRVRRRHANTWLLPRRAKLLSRPAQTLLGTVSARHTAVITGMGAIVVMESAIEERMRSMSLSDIAGRRAVIVAVSGLWAVTKKRMRTVTISRGSRVVMWTIVIMARTARILTTP